MLTGGILNGYVIVIWENETIMSTVKKNSIRLVRAASFTNCSSIKIPNVTSITSIISNKAKSSKKSTSYYSCKCCDK